MADFHQPGDHFPPNQGIVGWVEDDPDEDPEEIEEEEIEEDEIDEEIDDDEEEKGDSDTEFEVINPPYIVRVLAHRLGYNVPTPPGIGSREAESTPGATSALRNGVTIL